MVDMKWLAVILIPIVGVICFGYYTDYETRNIHPVEVQTHNDNVVVDTTNSYPTNDSIINANTIKLDLTDFSVDDNGNYVVKDKNGKVIDCFHFHKNLAGSNEVCRINHNLKTYTTYDELQDDVYELQNENDRLKSILDDNDINY